MGTIIRISNGIFTAQYPVMPQEHFNGARAPIERVGMRARYHQEVMVDSGGRQRLMKSLHGLSIEVLVAGQKTQPKRRGVGGLVTVEVKDIFTVDYRGYDVVLMYLLPDMILPHVASRLFPAEVTTPASVIHTSLNGIVPPSIFRKTVGKTGVE